MTASITVIIIRAFLPLTVLFLPLGGALLSILGDTADVFILEKFGWGFFGNGSYHHLDKIFDTWYLFLEFLVVFRWKDILARRAAKTLFFWRFVGFALFEITGLKFIFVLAPNIFENFYLLWTIMLKIRPDIQMTLRGLIITVLIAGLPKIIQEYLMHFKYPDQTWNFFRDNFFWWLYG